MSTIRSACFALAFALIASCGGDGGTTQPTPSSDVTRVDGVLSVGARVPNPPFADIDATGNVIGFDADLIEEIASRLELEVEWVEAPSDSLFTQLAAGSIDVVVSATMTSELAGQISFTIPYYSTQLAFAVDVNADPPIRGAGELGDGDSVAVQTGSIGAQWAAERLVSLGVEVREFDAVGGAFDALEAGQVTAVVVDEQSAVAEVANRSGSEIVAVIATETQYRFAVDPTRSTLREELDAILRAVFDDGTYQAIYDTWFQTPGGSVVPGFVASQLQFVAATPVVGQVGVEYFFDFCGPGEAPPTQGLSLLDCSPGPGRTPSGGHPPYHFQLDSGSGFPPMGLHLQKDGVINGTPTTATTGTTFRVCAVDLDANQACGDVTIIIGEPAVYAFGGTWHVNALSAVCPAGDGTWEATLTVSGGRLTGTWSDTFHGDTQYQVDVPLAGNSATWTVDQGEWSITLTGTFDFENGTVAGTLVGPVCTQTAGRWDGTFEGEAG